MSSVWCPLSDVFWMRLRLSVIYIYGSNKCYLCINTLFFPTSIAYYFVRDGKTEVVVNLGIDFNSSSNNWIWIGVCLILLSTVLENFVVPHRWVMNKKHLWKWKQLVNEVQCFGKFLSHPSFVHIFILKLAWYICTVLYRIVVCVILNV